MGGMNWDRARRQGSVLARGSDRIDDDPTWEPPAPTRPAKAELERAAWQRRATRDRRAELAETIERVRSMAPAARAAQVNSLRNKVGRLTATRLEADRVWSEHFAPLFAPPRRRQSPNSRAAATRPSPPQPTKQAARPTSRHAQVESSARSLVRAYPRLLTPETAAQVLRGVGTPPRPAMQQSQWWGRHANVKSKQIQHAVLLAVEAGRLRRGRDGVLAPSA